MNANYKPVGGVESVALYPADAVVTALFSSSGCEVSLSGTPLEVELLEGLSHFEEYSEVKNGATRIVHELHLVADREEALPWLEREFLERIALEGSIAVVTLCDGRRLLVGYSALFGEEQPLRLDKLTSASGNSPHDTPTVTLQLSACDREFAQPIL